MVTVIVARSSVFRLVPPLFLIPPMTWPRRALLLLGLALLLVDAELLCERLQRTTPPQLHLAAPSQAAPDDVYLAAGLPALRCLAAHLAANPNAPVRHLLLSDASQDDLDRDFGYIWYRGPWVDLTDADRTRQAEVRANHILMDDVTRRTIREMGTLMGHILQSAVTTLRTLAFVTYSRNPENQEIVEEEEEGYIDPRVAAMVDAGAYPVLTHLTLRDHGLGRASDLFNTSSPALTARFPELTHLHTITTDPNIRTLPVIPQETTPRLDNLRLSGAYARRCLPRELLGPRYYTPSRKVPTPSPRIPARIDIEPDFSPLLWESSDDLGCGTPHVEYMELYSADFAAELAAAFPGAASAVRVVPPREVEYAAGRQYDLARAVAEFLAYVDGEQATEPDRDAKRDFWWERHVKPQSWRDVGEL
ncbi:hypothetical protein MIND_01241300 [Mycena indigotica]|uniref:Uncharacterized protein n=1 Tax=Mycena indigotica TaxID=2126181 RepID=A0A8H6VVY8_9AGAR|nr:uncharacterized protein MIND_01241300 [Mycena indigotica]KAF7292143.1 hypothetical protein MIND_01241300 [Mycena indigotica]